MDPRSQRTSCEQFATMLELMELNGDLTRPQSGPQGRQRAERLWRDLAEALNAVGTGGQKTVERWKKVWADLKTKTKKKAMMMRRHAGGTGGGPHSRQVLAAHEERVLAVMGLSAVDGLPQISEHGFNMANSSAAVQGEPAEPAEPAGIAAEGSIEFLWDDVPIEVMPQNHWPPAPLPSSTTENATSTPPAPPAPETPALPAAAAASTPAQLPAPARSPPRPSSQRAQSPHSTTPTSYRKKSGLANETVAKRYIRPKVFRPKGREPCKS